MVCFDILTWDCESFESTKILIVTTYIYFIKGWINPILDDKILDIHVKEISDGQVRLWKSK